VIGKKGPAAIQDLKGLESKNANVKDPNGIFIDDATNHAENPDGTPTRSTTLQVPLAVDVFAATGETAPALTSTPNLTQQSYLLSATTQVLIPNLKDAGKPFVMLFWSRDPDATQHNALDSDGHLVPGINSPNARAAIANADNDLKGILDALAQYGLADNTDIFVIADHGFSTVAKGLPNPDGSMQPPRYPRGFLALEVADWLGGQKVFDPDRANAEIDRDGGDHPQGGNALLGPSRDAPMAMVAANGGSDLIYVPDGPSKRATAKRIFDKLVAAPYVGALFVNDDLLKDGDPKDFAGALPMSEINLMGSATVPRPAFVVGFRSFVAKGCALVEQMCTAEIADTPLRTGQGMHGSFSRADTRNFMAATGPDFKAKFTDTAPVGNADVAPTIAHVLGVDLPGPGSLKGRVIAEALVGGKTPTVTKRTVASAKAARGVQTILDLEEVGSTRYFDAAGIAGRTEGLRAH